MNLPWRAPELWWLIGGLAIRWTRWPYPDSGFWRASSFWFPAVLTLACFANLWLASPEWWLLVRTTAVCGAGVWVLPAVLGQKMLGQKMRAETAGAGVAAAYTAAVIVNLTVLGIATWAALGWTSFRGPNPGPFLRQAGWALLALAVLGAGVPVWARNRVDRATGEDKARALSAWYGRSIGAKDPAAWREHHWNWVRFALHFVAPDRLELHVRTNYVDSTTDPDGKFQVRNPGQLIEQMRGPLGKVILEELGTTLPWRPDWDGETLVWTAGFSLSELTVSAFERHTAEAIRLYNGALGPSAPHGGWLLMGRALSATLHEPVTARERGLRWLAESLRFSAHYAHHGIGDPIPGRLAKSRYREAEMSRSLEETERMLRTLADRADDTRTGGGGAAPLLREVETVLSGRNRQLEALAQTGDYLHESFSQARMAIRYLRTAGVE
jgi:hypothetical protein